MDLGLSGKNVAITGGSRGIGRAIALEFAREGAGVAICARGEAALAATAREVTALGARVHAAICDVGRPELLDRFLEGTRATLGSVDILVNNASGFGMSDDEASWQAAWSVDVMGAVRASHRVAPWMAARGGGAIVHVSSISALEAGGLPAYAAGKAALLAHARSLAARLAPNGIRVNVVAPGSIEFPGGFWAAARDAEPELYRATRAAIPSGRLGTPDEVAAVVVFIASPRARWITGATVVVDGGQHKGVP
jgi:3-oxoacyl-[acyl-carrier protein] reductase